MVTGTLSSSSSSINSIGRICSLWAFGELVEPWAGACHTGWGITRQGEKCDEE